MKQFAALFFLLFSTLFYQSFAQNVTGTWHGSFQGQNIVVSIEQKDTMLCGFTHDYIIEDSTDNCTAAYSGAYHPRYKVYIMEGNRFIKNSGSHVLMYIVLKQNPKYGSQFLIGKIYTGNMLSRLLGLDASNILLKKVSSRPTKLAGGEPNCFPKPKPIPRPQPIPAKPPKPTVPVPKPDPVKPKPAPVTPKPVPAPVKPAVPKPDTPKKIQPEVPVTQKRDAEIVKDMIRRKQSEVSRLEVSVKQINLKVYDNGVVDNDTVSIFYNGKLLLSHQRLSESPIIINLDLEDNVTEHKITMYAENLGGIPPNTALIVVTAGDKRYELRSKASLEENAVLIFDYRPK